MEGCLSTVQVTPPMENKPAFAQHILWAPKKKRCHRRVISDIPSGGRVNTHSKIRKRLIFPCLEESERKEKEEALSNMPDCTEELNNDERISARTPDCSEDKLKRNRSGVQLDLSKATNLRVEYLKANQKGARNADPQRIKRKLALSSFRWNATTLFHKEQTLLTSEELPIWNFDAMVWMQIETTTFCKLICSNYW